MSRLSKNIAYNVVGQSLSLILSFVAVRFVFRGLGGDALGLIYFNQSVSVALMMALELGIYKTIVREVASHRQSNPDYVRRLIGTATTCYWIGYLILAGVIYGLAPVLVKHWVHLEAMRARMAIDVMRVLAVGTLLTLPRSLYDSVLLGLERMGYTNVLRIGITANQQAGIFIVLLLRGDLFAVAYWIGFSYLAGLVTYFIVCSRFLSCRFLWPRFDFEVVRKNWAFSAHAFNISISGWFLGESDKFIISRLLPLGVMGYYTVAKGAVARCAMLMVAINEATYPHMSNLFNSRDMESFRSEYRRLQDLVCLGILPLYAALPFVALPVFSFMFNVRVAHTLLLPVTILALGSYMYGTVTIVNVVALAAGRPDIIARLNYFAVFVVVLGYIVFIRLWGLNGAGLGWVLYPVLAYAYSVPRVCRECLAVPIGQWFVHIFKIIGLAAGTYALAWLVVCHGEPLTLSYSMSAYLLATVAFALAAFAVMGPELRASFRQVLGMLGLRTAAVTQKQGRSVPS